MQRTSWLMLLYALPTNSKAERVSLWRRLKKFGALQFKTSAYILPDEPQHLERFQWLAKQVRDGGGEASVIQVSRIEGMTDEQVAALFNEERSRDYQDLLKQLRTVVRRGGKKHEPAYITEVEKLRRRFQEIRAIDYFSSPAGHDVEIVLNRAVSPVTKESSRRPELKREAFQNKQWLTRPRPEIDRVGSAWLIQRSIDSNPTFVFGTDPKDYSDAIPYDMTDVEFTHHGEDCTFETLLKRFRITDKRLHVIGEMIHDADLEDEKFQRPECIGIDRVLKGYGAIGLKDEEILKRGFEAFDGLYAALRKP